MMGRHELREQVFRLLFRAEFHSAQEMEEQKKLYAVDLPAEDTVRAAGEKDMNYIVSRCSRVQEKIAEIDRIIDENTEGWDTTRMGKVELTALRLGVYEILFDEDIPDSVAINEGIELAKQYGQENSGAFVNAIFTKIMKNSKTGESNS